MLILERKNKVITFAIILLGLLLFFAVLYFTPPLRHDVKVLSTRAVDSVQDRVPVLLYHHLLQNGEGAQYQHNGMVVTTEQFERQMQVLRDYGYQTITAEQLQQFIAGSIKLPKKSVLITFDDGYESNYVYAYPILKKYGLKATMFIIGANIRDYGEPFKPDELQYISTSSIRSSGDVFEFGSHTYDLHRIGTDKKSALVKTPKEQVLQDLEKSKQYTDTTAFAYPYGMYNRQAIEAVKQTGFTMAFTTKSDKVSKFTNLYAIPRYTVYRDTKIKAFKQMIGIYE